MRIVSVILEHKVITKILGHLARKGIEPRRPSSRSIRSAGSTWIRSLT